MSSVPVAASLDAATAVSAIAVGYVYENTAGRTSSLSAAEQQSVISRYARSEGMALQSIVTDASASISSRRQPQLASLLRGEVGGSWDVLLVARLDRLTRDVTQLHTILSRIQSLGGSHHLVSVSEGIDTRREDGKFCAHLIQIFSSWDRTAIPDRTREWVANKRQRGEPIGHAPYGYHYVHKALVESPAEQAVIRLIRELRATALSYEKIARHLNSKQIPSKRGGGWYPETVKAVCCRGQGLPYAISGTPLQPHEAE